ncbi:hypothetical protein J6TS2_27320 [Heyndrickxia sporothermodurans]|nr:hypothetical protein J6TS2_27320 [Heyndrickxia sporothermodurans]
MFVPVRNLVKWYSKIFGFEGGEIFFGHIYTAPMEETAGLVLDTIPNWDNENGIISTYQVPSIRFVTNDIHASYQIMKENDVEHTRTKIVIQQNRVSLFTSQ